MDRRSNFNQNYEDWLESDDELPSFYKETPEVPAYLNDNRFDPIKFNWIINANVISKNLSGDKNYGYKNITELCNGKNWTIKGILSKEDVFCLKCLERNTADGGTVLWFVNFLMFKDLQSHYNFLKSCLMNDETGTINKTNKTEQCKENFPSLTQKYNYRIIVKY